MTTPTLTLIIPTAGRESLRRTLDSAAPQILPGDECLVLGDTTDGPLPSTEMICRDYAWVRYIAQPGDAHTYGHEQFDAGQRAAQGDWLLGNDDDDIWTSDAFASIRETIASLDYLRPLLFQFHSHWNQVFWHTAGYLAQGHIGGHCLVQPNVHDKVGQRAVDGSYRYESDFDWIVDTVARWAPVEPLWVPTLIARARPA